MRLHNRIRKVSLAAPISLALSVLLATVCFWPLIAEAQATNPDLDLITRSGTTRYFYSNNGSGSFTQYSSGSGGTALSEEDGIGDIDNDGDLDYVMANDSGPNRVYVNNGSGSFSLAESSAESENTNGVAFGDLDGDGDLDYIAGNYGFANRVYINNGSGSFSSSQTTSESDQTVSIAVGDLDGDGDLDYIAGNYNNPNRVYINNGSGSFSLSESASESDPTVSSGLVDIDNDGDLDYIAGNYGAANRVYVNNGSGSFSLSESTSQTDNTREILVGDIDNDGDIDYIAGNYGVANRAYKNNGSGSFSLFESTSETDYTTSGAIGDIDADGDLDYIAGNENDYSRVYKNNGSGSFSLSSSLSVADHSYSVSIGDLDGDGDSLTELACSDGIDNDYDGWTDGQDSDCSSVSEGLVSASGGNNVYEVIDGGTVYKVHEFTSSGTFNVNNGGTVEYLIVGGGGGGGSRRAGGGGAGGMLTGSTSITSGSKTVTVGTGGAAGNNSLPGSDGGDSSFLGNTAVGGGGGGSEGDNGNNGFSGGSGGGAGSGGVGGSGTSGQGFAGGDDTGGSDGAGGGGAGEVGGDDDGVNPANGGDGLQSDITGTNTYYAGGGGGDGNDGTGGLGGGGDAGGDSGTATAGVDGLGGGGGACGFIDCLAADGGDGIVIVRYEAAGPDADLFGEAGSVTVVADGTWSTVNFQGSYETPIVIGTTNTDNNGGGLIFEARNVTETSAEIRICKALGSSGAGCDPAATSNETVGYLVVDQNHMNQSTFPSVEAETISLNGGESSAQAVTFNKSFSQTPYIFASVQTNNGDDGVEIKIDSVTTSGFNISLCEPNGDTCDTGHTTEVAGWIAIEPGGIPWSQTSETGLATGIGGSTWTNVSFSESYPSAPVVIAQQQTENGGQDGEIDEARSVTTSGAQVRYCELDASGVCDSHAGEDVAWMAVSIGGLSAGRASVSTQPMSNISTTTATANGVVEGTGDDAIVSSRGFVYDTSSHNNPGDTAPGSAGYSNFITESGSFSTGPFTGSMTNLIATTLYYVRAYVQNSVGYTYGREVSFITETDGAGIDLSGISTWVRGGTTIRGGTIVR